MNFIVNILITLIRIYQNTISLLFPSTCRFYPSCSNYMIQSIKKYGIYHGVTNGVKRVSKCHPYAKVNNWDPV